MRSIKLISASTLAEVLVVLAIAASTLVVISQLTVQLMVTVKDNEVRDYATSVAIQALEIAKSPDRIVIYTGNFLPRVPGTYRIDASEGSLYKVAETSRSSTLTTDNCNEESPFYVQSELESQFGNTNPVVCAELIIDTRTNDLDAAYFQFNIKTVIITGSTTEQFELVAYRERSQGAGVDIRSGLQI